MFLTFLNSFTTLKLSNSCRITYFIDYFTLKSFADKQCITLLETIIIVKYLS